MAAPNNTSRESPEEEPGELGTPQFSQSPAQFSPIGSDSAIRSDSGSDSDTDTELSTSAPASPPSKKKKKKSGKSKRRLKLVGWPACEKRRVKKRQRKKRKKEEGGEWRPGKNGCSAVPSDDASSHEESSEGSDNEDEIEEEHASDGEDGEEEQDSDGDEDDSARVGCGDARQVKYVHHSLNELGSDNRQLIITMIKNEMRKMVMAEAKHQRIKTGDRPVGTYDALVKMWGSQQDMDIPLALKMWHSFVGSFDKIRNYDRYLETKIKEYFGIEDHEEIKKKNQKKRKGGPDYRGPIVKEVSHTKAEMLKNLNRVGKNSHGWKLCLKRSTAAKEIQEQRNLPSGSRRMNTCEWYMITDSNDNFPLLDTKVEDIMNMTALTEESVREQKLERKLRKQRDEIKVCVVFFCSNFL